MIDTSPIGAVLLKAWAAGVCIGLGNLAYISCENHYIGAALFSVGLISIMIFGFQLYTGSVCYLDNYKHPWILILTFLWNHVGATFMGSIANDMGSDRMKKTVTEIWATKMGKTPLQVFLSAIVCGLCIGVAVRSRMLVLTVMSIMIFILSGGEHVIANAFYMIQDRYSIGSTWHHAWFLLLTLLGNTLGGLIFGGFVEIGKMKEDDYGYIRKV